MFSQILGSNVWTILKNVSDHHVTFMVDKAQFSIQYNASQAFRENPSLFVLRRDDRLSGIEVKIASLLAFFEANEIVSILRLADPRDASDGTLSDPLAVDVTIVVLFMVDDAIAKFTATEFVAVLRALLQPCLPIPIVPPSHSPIRTQWLRIVSGHMCMWRTHTKGFYRIWCRPYSRTFVPPSGQLS